MKYFLSFLLVLLILNSVNLSAQQLSTDRTLYHSEVDELLTIRKISVLPIMDNVGGIYARPVEKHLIETVKKDHHWDYIEINLIGPLVSPEELESHESKVAKISAGLNSDAILSARIIKGPGGISMKINMFSTRDYKLLAQAKIKEFKRFEIKELEEKSDELFNMLISKIPYQGIILSRHGQRVTVNLGKRDGIENGKVLSIIQIVKANRHPKFNFLINVEKEILGKIKLLKVDETLSFGKIILEKEKGVIQANSKISGLEFVKYGYSNSLSNNTSTQDQLLQRPDGLVSFGKSATAWLPKKPPTFGMASAGIGNSLYSYTIQQSTGLNTDSLFNPSISLGLELWVTPEWTMHTSMRQGILSIENPGSGSTPSDLSASMSYFEFLVGYRFRMSPSVWGPQIELLGGMANYDLKVDDSSPRTLTSTKYSGIKLGLLGSYPVDLQGDWSVGANLSFFFKPRVSESPSPSGSNADSSINRFGLFVFRKLGINIRAQADLDFELFKTNFSASSASTSSSQKYTSLNFSLGYMF